MEKMQESSLSCITCNTIECSCSTSTVKVAIRVRPLNANELSQTTKECITCNDNNNTIQLIGKKDINYTFDAVFGPTSDQEPIFHILVQPLIDTFFQGYNATVFAYGQTGSGKTYTMGNEFKLNVSLEKRGIIPRVMDEIFNKLNKRKEMDDKKTTLIKISYLEILNEEIRDLLCPYDQSNKKKKMNNDSPNNNINNLSIRDDGSKGIVISGLTEHEVHTIEQVENLLRTGFLQRSTASTSMNTQSSRSHAICTIFMEQYDTISDDGIPVDTRFSKFHLVDLAGSERAKKTNSEGQRFKEGVNINKGLLALGNVINALSDNNNGTNNNGNRHVPYRDSKITRLLQDSLGGNSKTVMIACVSPSNTNFDESLNTLRYANRAKNITNKPVVNREQDEMEVVYLRRQVELLKAKLMLYQTIGSKSSNALNKIYQSVSEKENQNSDEESELMQSCIEAEQNMLTLIDIKEKWKNICYLILDNHVNQTKNSYNNGKGSSWKYIKELIEQASSFEKQFTLESSISANKDNLTLGEISSFDEIMNVSTESTNASDNMDMSSDHSIHSPSQNYTNKENNDFNNESFTLTEIAELSDAISIKESILKELAVNNNTFSNHKDTDNKLYQLKTMYHEKIIKLQQEIDILQKEKLSFIEESNKKNDNDDLDKKKRLISLQKKISELTKQINITKQLKKECDSLKKLNKQGQLKISSLETVIQNMKYQKASLQRKYREDNEYFRKEKKTKDLKIVQLQRNEQKKNYEIKKLEISNNNKNNILKRKTEEINLVNKKLKQILQLKQQNRFYRSKENYINHTNNSDNSNNSNNCNNSNNSNNNGNNNNYNNNVATKKFKQDNERKNFKKMELAEKKRLDALIENEKLRITSTYKGNYEKQQEIILKQKKQVESQLQEINRLKSALNIEKEKNKKFLIEKNIPAVVSNKINNSPLETKPFLKKGTGSSSINNIHNRQLQKEPHDEENDSDSDFVLDDDEEIVSETEDKINIKKKKNNKKKIDNSLEMHDENEENDKLNYLNCCSCKGKCKTNRCACRLHKNNCGNECKCNSTMCLNRLINNNDDDKENIMIMSDNKKTNLEKISENFFISFSDKKKKDLLLLSSGKKKGLSNHNYNLDAHLINSSHSSDIIQTNVQDTL